MKFISSVIHVTQAVMLISLSLNLQYKCDLSGDNSYSNLQLFVFTLKDSYLW